MIGKGSPLKYKKVRHPAKWTLLQTGVFCWDFFFTTSFESKGKNNPHLSDHITTKQELLLELKEFSIVIQP